MENEPELFKSESYPNGNKKTEEFFVDSDGETLVLSIRYYENGVKSIEELYHPPLQSGDRDDFYIISSTNWYEDGQVDEEYIINKPHKAKYEVGDIISYKTKFNYYDNGQMKGERHFKELFTDIAWYCEDDPVLVKTAKMHPSNQDILHGKHIEWYENGQISEETNYKDNKEDGKMASWYKDGQKLAEGNYKNDELNGKWISWYEDGQKSQEGKSINGKKEGKWTEWDENGKIIVQDNYKGGKLVK
jgi:antitoxin component YwqK of YwqJK toxin-antitoxin module